MCGGYVVVPLNLLAQPSQLEYVLSHSGAKLVFADAENIGRVTSFGVPVIEIDVDSDRRAAFGPADKEMLEAIARLLAPRLSHA